VELLKQNYLLSFLCSSHFEFHDGKVNEKTQYIVYLLLIS